MSVVHLKTRRQRIAINQKLKEPKRNLWKVDGHTIEVLEPREAETCCSTTSHGGVYYDGVEKLGPGRMGRRFGFIIGETHYQVWNWEYKFTGVKETRGGKFLLFVDGWEAISQRPINHFMRNLYFRVMSIGFILLAVSCIGIAGAIESKNAIISGWVGRTMFVFLPLGLYYMYVGFIGVVKHHLKMPIDVKALAWWPHVTDESPTAQPTGIIAESGLETHSDDDVDDETLAYDADTALSVTIPGASSDSIDPQRVHAVDAKTPADTLITVAPTSIAAAPALGEQLIDFSDA
eukprot:m.116178 g.116178  ORF g.116178 m.116178 type:complete len:291 (-) comp17168_c0_seq9:18-890(-)